MFKNLIVYRVGPEWPASAMQLVRAIEAAHGIKEKPNGL